MSKAYWAEAFKNGRINDEIITQLITNMYNPIKDIAEKR